MLELAQKYAELRGTTVIAHKVRDDGSIVFVLESGPKLTMTEQELCKELPSPKPVSKPKARKSRKK